MEDRAYGRNTVKYLTLDEGLLNRKRNEDSYQRHLIKLEYGNWCVYCNGQ